MSATLKNKIEDALTGYLKQFASSDFDGLNISEGHTGEENDLPLLVVVAGEPALFEDMPPATGVREIPLTCRIEALSAATARATLDGWLACLESRLYSIDAIRAYANKTAVADARAVTGIHVYDCYPTGNASDQDGDLWVEDLQAAIVCGLHDAF